MRRGMWAMITLLDVFDCSFSESLVQRFSAPGKQTKKGLQWRLLRLITHCWTKIQEATLTLLLSNSPHHEVHTGGISLTTQFEWAQFTLEVLNIVKNPLQLWLAAAKLLQYKVMNLLHIVCLKFWQKTNYASIIIIIEILGKEKLWFCYWII